MLPTKRKTMKKRQIITSSSSSLPPSSPKINSTQLTNKIDALSKTYNDNKCEAFTEYDNTSHVCNKTVLEMEKTEHDILSVVPDKSTSDNNKLYPSLNDPNFNAKIALKQEFNDTKYDGKIRDVESYSNELNNAPFELSPHQAFVKNFLSFQTPYNSLLLYHGLGSGKTCSAIGVCEEQRDYLNQMGIVKPIIIVASPNVQDNFRLQLFDERKLLKDEITGAWNISACVGNKLLREINPTNMTSLSKQNISKQINDLIDRCYLFVGYIQFSNMIEHDMNALNETYDNTLIVIDEVHNIRIADDTATKTTATNLMKLVQTANNLRLLLLSATPMYNNYTEIIWLINLMNINDKRGAVGVSDIFNSTGEFKDDAARELFIRKCTGYISFVRGENPYTFPFRIYPNTFSKEDTFLANSNTYPTHQMNGQLIKTNDALKQQIIPIFLTNIGETQMWGYKIIINELRKAYIDHAPEADSASDLSVVSEMPSFENMETFGFKLLQKPLEALIMIYPVKGMQEYAESLPSIAKQVELIKQKEESDATISNQLQNTSSEKTISPPPENEPDEESSATIVGGNPTSSEFDLSRLTGKSGLKHAMKFNDKQSGAFDFEYKHSKRFFSREHVGKYSSKIKNVCDSICSYVTDPTTNEPVAKVCDGIVLIYSQQLYGGVIPIALALEEMGFVRYGKANPLFGRAPEMKSKEKQDIKSALQTSGNKYVLITGNEKLSPDNDADIKALTGDENTNDTKESPSGSVVKVVIISMAGSEGIDLKAIRQIHILDPWYNMNRIEQIIGRGVRNFSHKTLSFEKRNVQIFLYATLLTDNEEEAADLYVYRVAEKKAQQIGKISRVLKQTAVDCILNHEQTELTQENFKKQPITQEMSTYGKIKTVNDFYAGDAPYSAACDYQGTCEYDCAPTVTKEEETNNINIDTYNEKFVMMNSDKIIQKIKILFKSNFFYKKQHLVKQLKFPITQIHAALNVLLTDNTERIVDAYGRPGKLVNIGEYYLFQPDELNYKNVAILNRNVPIDYKHSSIKINMSERTKNYVSKRRSKFEEEYQESEPEPEPEQAQDLERAFVGEEEEPEKEVIKTAAKAKTKARNEIIRAMVQNYDAAIQAKEEYAKLIQTKPTDKELVEYEMILEKRAKRTQTHEEDVMFKNIKKQYEEFKGALRKLVASNDNVWYNSCGIAMHKLLNYGFVAETIKPAEASLNDYLIAHIVDVLPFNDKMEVLNYLYKIDEANLNEIEKTMKDYFNNKIIKYNGKMHIIFYTGKTKINDVSFEDESRKILVLKQRKWVEVDAVGEENFYKKISELKTNFAKECAQNKINYLFGFIGHESSTTSNVNMLLFKVKDINNARNNTGARCDQSSKIKSLNILNELVKSESFFTNDTTKGSSTDELCAMQELLFRHYDTTKEDGKMWFLTPEYAELYNIERCKIKNKTITCA
jgi:superfamily II DNA or RNA helicase